MSSIRWFLGAENSRQHALMYSTEYTRAISRPRTESELIDEEMAYSNRPTTASKTSVDALQDMILLDDSEEESRCTVCLEELSVGSKMKRMPCSHVFHQECITQWLQNSSHMCPVCLYELPF